MNWVFSFTLVCSNMVLTSCSNRDEAVAPDKTYTGVPLVILDADIGSSTDDLFALEMLYRYDEQRLCRLLGVVVDREGEANADFTDVMNTYFGHPYVPIGLVKDGIKNPKVWIDYAVLNGVELVRRKVKCIYMQGGVFDKAEEPDYNFLQGITFAQTFFDLWPKDVDMVFSPMEVGQTVEYTPEQVIADVSWTDRHPIKQVYMTCDCNTGQRMWDPMCVIQAIEGDSLFTLSERFTINITPEAYTVFTPTPAGNARYQKPGDAQWAAMILEKIRTMNKMK